MDICNLPDEEFKVMVIKIFMELRRMDEHSKNFNKVTENTCKYKTEKSQS